LLSKFNLYRYTAAAAVAAAKEVADNSYTVAGIVLKDRRDALVVWAKLPGHPFWPGLKVGLYKL
jgi:hypothetical protein